MPTRPAPENRSCAVVGMRALRRSHGRRARRPCSVRVTRLELNAHKQRRHVLCLTEAQCMSRHIGECGQICCQGPANLQEDSRSRMYLALHVFLTSLGESCESITAPDEVLLPRRVSELDLLVRPHPHALLQSVAATGAVNTAITHQSPLHPRTVITYAVMSRFHTPTQPTHLAHGAEERRGEVALPEGRQHRDDELPGHLRPRPQLHGGRHGCAR